MMMMMNDDVYDDGHDGDDHDDDADDGDDADAMAEHMETPLHRMPMTGISIGADDAQNLNQHASSTIDLLSMDNESTTGVP
eukprot:788123-Karenia_brevis.AAC.1